MKKLAVALILGTLAMSASAKDWKEVRLASEGAYAPFNTLATDGSLAGLDIDVGNAICAEMKLKCVWVKQEWDGMIPALLARKFDAIIASMSVTAERKAKVDFTHKYYSSPLVLVGKSGSPLKPDVASLKGKKVGVQRGTIMDNYATKFFGKQGVTVTRYAKVEESYADLKSGRLDAVLAEYFEIKLGFLAGDDGKGFAVLGDKIYGNTPEEKAVIGEGIAIAIRKQDKDLTETFNKGIDAIRANGTYDKIVQKYFGNEDIYGK